MNDHDDVLERTLRSLERSLPVTSHDRGRPSQHRRPRRSRWTSPIVAAVALVALAGGATGSAVVSEVVRGHPGLFAPGGILYCTRIKDMTPREADAVLTELGYDVTWQVEDRTAGTSTQTTTAQRTATSSKGWSTVAHYSLSLRVARARYLCPQGAGRLRLEAPSRCLTQVEATRPEPLTARLTATADALVDVVHEED